MKFEEINKGNGLKYQLVITADSIDDFNEAMESALKDLGCAMKANESASDTFFYKFEMQV